MMEKELKQVQEKAAALESLDKLRTRLGDRQCELAWAIVKEKEIEYKSKQKKVDKSRQDRPKYERKVEKYEVCLFYNRRQGCSASFDADVVLNL